MKRPWAKPGQGRTRRLLAVVTALVGAFALVTAVAADSHLEITIPIDTIVTDVGEGSETVLAALDVPLDSQGQECSVTAESRNQESVHPDNDLVVRSGGSEVVLPDVESESGGIVAGEGTLVLGPTITVTLVMGEDDQFSAGIDVVIDCVSQGTTTTTTPTTTVPEEPTTTVPEEPTTTVPGETTTTAPPEATTTTIPDEVSPTQVTTTTSPPEVQPTSVTPSTLPFTGAATENLALIALVLTGLGALFLVATRRPSED